MTEITENVKRAARLLWGAKGATPVEEMRLALKMADIELGQISLEDALDLLHFAADRVYPERDTDDRCFFGFYGTKWCVGYAAAWDKFTEETTTSPIDAVLKAVDAIVAHKPEVFA